MYVCVPGACLGSSVETQELEFQVAMSHHIGARNWIWVLWGEKYLLASLTAELSLPASITVYSGLWATSRDQVSISDCGYHHTASDKKHRTLYLLCDLKSKSTHEVRTPRLGYYQQSKLGFKKNQTHSLVKYELRKGILCKLMADKDLSFSF